MKRKTLFTGVAIVIAVLGGFIAVKAQGAQPQSPSALQGSAFTYQGQLKGASGQPLNSNCNFQFSLWNSPGSGTGQLGAMQPINGVSVSNGVFTVSLNGNGEFGANPFDGNARWLQIAVQCGSDGGFTPLTPRQALTAAPYAIGLKPGARIEANYSLDLLTVIQLANSGSVNAIHAHSDAPFGSGVWGTGFAGNGVTGGSDTGRGVLGSSNTGIGVQGYSTQGNGLQGSSSSNSNGAIWGNNAGGGDGISGNSTFGIGVHGTVTNTNPAVQGTNTGSGAGVFGDTTDGTGVKGNSTNYFGVAGYTTNGTGVFGDNGNNDTIGHAGYFHGRVHVTQGLAVDGNLSANNMPGLAFGQALNGSGTVLNPPSASADFDSLTIHVPAAGGYLFLSAFVHVDAFHGDNFNRMFCQSFRIYDVTNSQYLVSTEALKWMSSGGIDVGYSTDLHLSWVVAPPQGTLVLKTNGANCGGVDGVVNRYYDHNFTAVYLPVLH